jgi:hypothetical protein
MEFLRIGREQNEATIRYRGHRLSRSFCECRKKGGDSTVAAVLLLLRIFNG